MERSLKKLYKEYVGCSIKAFEKCEKSFKKLIEEDQNNYLEKFNGKS